MTVRQMRYLGDPILRKKCRPVQEINDEIRQIAQDLEDTVKVHNGAGLAAPQIGYDYRIFICNLSDEIDEEGYPLDAEPKIFINPEITFRVKKTMIHQEGCLSIPGIYADVNRRALIDVKAMGMDGKIFEEKGLKNWRSVNIQHELDHLDGILYIDRLSEEKRKELEGQLFSLEMKLRSQSFMPKDFL